MKKYDNNTKEKMAGDFDDLLFFVGSEQTRVWSDTSKEMQAANK